jgi:hypothetical protein
MYGWLWSHLPERWGPRLATLVIIVVATVFVLFRWVFPWLEPHMPFSGNGSIAN